MIDIGAILAPLASLVSCLLRATEKRDFPESQNTISDLTPQLIPWTMPYGMQNMNSLTLERPDGGSPATLQQLIVTADPWKKPELCATSKTSVMSKRSSESFTSCCYLFDFRQKMSLASVCPGVFFNFATGQVQVPR